MLLTSAKSLSYLPNKIISLVPSQTELLFHLGLDEEVAGITKFCVHPDRWFISKQKTGGTKTVNMEKIRELNPDLIIANKEENVKAQVELLANEFPVWVTDVNNLEEALTMINDIGELTNRVNEAYTLTTGIRDKFSKMPVHLSPLKTCYLIWRKPYMTVGGDTFINNMMEYCSLQNILKIPTVTRK